MNSNSADMICISFKRMGDLYGVTGKNGIQFKPSSKRLNVALQTSDSHITSAFEA